MRIYLTKFDTLYTEEKQLISDVVYPQHVHWFPDTYKRVSSGLVYVPNKLLDRLVSPALAQYITDNPVHGKSAFILAGGSQTWGSGGVPLYKQHFDNSLAYAYKMEVFSLTNIFASRLASQLGIHDYMATDASACASSLKVMMDVRHLIQLYDFDRVVVLALEDSVTNASLSFFGSAKANICLDDEQLGKVASAFDKTNGGFHIGQGACLAVFESARALSKIGSDPRAELLGAYTSGEANANPIGQREDGQGYLRAIRGALELSKRSPSEVGIIKTHGTGTEVNNRSERAAIETLFDEFVATSFKQRIGHTVGASGLLETCILLDNIRQGGMVPEIKNRTEEDKKFISSPTEAPRGLLLSLAAGMGNVYSAALFDYYEHNKI
jgi:3-oxoacyl-(acyl-carrier-protein) synthase